MQTSNKSTCSVVLIARYTFTDPAQIQFYFLNFFVSFFKKGVKVCKRPDVCSSPLTGTQEIIRIAKRICGIWEIVAKGTEKFKSWEIDNIVLDNINYQTPVLKADKMLSDFKSRLGSREVLAEAIKESGYADVAERVRTGYYIKNKED